MLVSLLVFGTGVRALGSTLGFSRLVVPLLVLGVESAYLDRDTAEERLDTWRERRGYYVPVESVTEILDDEE